MADFSTTAGIRQEREQLFETLMSFFGAGVDPGRFFPDPNPIVRLLEDAETALLNEQ